MAGAPPDTSCEEEANTVYLHMKHATEAAEFFSGLQGHLSFVLLLTTESALHKIFEAFDSSGQGYLELEDFCQMVGTPTESVPSEEGSI